RIAKRELLAVDHDDVAFGFRPRLRVATDQVPIGSRHDDTRAETVLEKLCAASVVDMTMADEDILDSRWIQTEFTQAIDDLVLDRIIEERVDDDDPVRGRDGPRGIFRLAKVVEIVEDLRRLDMPLGARRRTLGLCRWLLSLSRLRDGGRRRTQVVEDCGVLLPGCSFGSCDMSLHRIAA